MRCDSQTLALVSFVIINAVFMCVSANRDWPPGLTDKMVPAPTFDEDAPQCGVHEACGFYSFTLKSRALRWIKSWCKCSEEQQCVYDKTDLKMRVYRQICRPKGELDVDEEAAVLAAVEGRSPAQISQEQAHLLAASRKRRAMMFLRNFQ